MKRVSNTFPFEVGLGDCDKTPCTVDYEGAEDDPCARGVKVYIDVRSEMWSDKHVLVDVWDSLDVHEKERVYLACDEDVREHV